MFEVLMCKWYLGCKFITTVAIVRQLGTMHYVSDSMSANMLYIGCKSMSN